LAVSKNFRFVLMMAASASASSVSGLVAVFGVVDGETGGLERGDIGGAEEVVEVVRGTAADDEDACVLPASQFAGCGWHQRAIAFAAFLR